MSTLSIPVDADMLGAIEQLVRNGFAANKSDAVRRALTMYLEEQAVQAVLRAEKEPRLKGDLEELAKKFK